MRAVHVHAGSTCTCGQYMRAVHVHAGSLRGHADATPWSRCTFCTCCCTVHAHMPMWRTALPPHPRPPPHPTPDTMRRMALISPARSFAHVHHAHAHVHAACAYHAAYGAHQLRVQLDCISLAACRALHELSERGQPQHHLPRQLEHRDLPTAKGTQRLRTLSGPQVYRRAQIDRPT